MGSHSRLKIIMPDEILAEPAPQSHPAAAYELRPMVQVRRLALIEREIREHLSQTALDAVLACAEILSEGDASPGSGKTVFLGSTMLTCDVATLGDILREPADEGTARRLATLLAGEKSLAARIEAIVRGEVERITRGKPKAVRSDTRIRTQGTRVFLDIDVEAVLP
jgi:hypothetical protein